MANLGTLTLDLVAKTGSFIGPLDKAGRQAKKTSKDVDDSFSDSLKSVTKWGFGLGVVATGAVVAFAKKSIDAASAINDVAKAANVSTDTLQEMRHAASLSGISFDELDGSLQKFNKSIGEARAGSGSLYSYLKKTDQALLDQVRSANSTDDALNLIFKAMKNVSNESERAALAAAAFGRSGVKLSVLADDYETLRKEAQSLGLVIDSQLIKNADEAGDKLETLSRVIGAQLTTAVLNLAPTIQKVAEQILKLSESTAKFFGGGTVTEIDIEIAALEELRSEYKQVEETYSTLKKQKGTLFAGEADTLKEAQNNIETLTESINQLNMARSGGAGKDGGGGGVDQKELLKKEKAIYEQFASIRKEAQGRDYEDTEALYNAKVELNNEFLKADQAQADIMLSAQESYNAAHLQLVEEADIAELNSKYYGVELEIKLHEYKFEKLKELYTEGSEALKEIERIEKAELSEINDDYWSGYLESLEENMASIDSIVGDSLNNLSSQFGDFFASAILDSENLDSAFKKMATSMVSTALSAIGKMIAQWLIYKVVKIATDKATQAAAIPSYVANAEAGALLAGINAYASAAAIPYAGWVLAPAAMASALAVTEPMAAAVSGLAAAGMAHDGIDSVPETGTWLLKKGERVTTSQTSKRLDDTLSRIQNGGTDSGRPYRAGGVASSGESHFHVHYDGPVFLNRSQMRDTAKMLMKETDRERTRIGAVN